MPNALRSTGNATAVPNGYAGSGYAGSPGSTAVQGQEIAYQSGGAPAVGMRQVDSQGNPPTGRLNPQDIASGLPYVTPPPRGRYPTSPYNHALFQTAAHQRQAVANANTASNAANPAAAGRTAYPAQPGIYPTAYQQGNGVVSTVSNPNVPTATPQATYPPAQAHAIYSSNNAGYQPMMSMGQEGYNVQVGRGLLGQPTVYVPGQPIRNFMRYIFP